MDSFARYPSRSYTVMPDGLLVEMIGRKVGRNGWAVMAALGHRVYADGKLGRVPAAELSGSFGLTPRQVAHGMEELRGKGVIAPVARRAADGSWAPDRSRFGHVAQYRIAGTCGHRWISLKAESRLENESVRRISRSRPLFGGDCNTR